MIIPAPQTSAPQPLPEPIQHPGSARRVLRCTVFVLLSLIVCMATLLASLLLFAYSSGGSRYIGQLTSSLVNGLDTGLQLEVEKLELDWPLTIKIYNAQLRDTEGLWLEVPYAESVLSLDSLVPQFPLRWQLHTTQTLVRQATWHRLPVLPSDPEAKSLPGPLTLLPAWLGITADAILLENMHIASQALALQPVAPYIQPLYIVHLRAQCSVGATNGTLNANAEVRPEAIAEASAGQDNIPQEGQITPPVQATQAVPSPRAALPEALGQSEQTMQPDQSEEALSLPLTRFNLKANFADSTISLKIDVQDTALLWPHLQTFLPPSAQATRAVQQGGANGTQDVESANNTASMLEALHIQGTLSAYVPSVPPTQQLPLYLQWQLNIAASPLLPTSLQGSLSLNDEGLEWEKVALHYPAQSVAQDAVPSISLNTGGSFGFARGPVAQVGVNISDISILQDFGLSLPSASGPLHASVQVNAAAKPDQPYLQVALTSPDLTLPQGKLQNTSLTLLARVPAFATPPAASAARAAPAAPVVTDPAGTPSVAASSAPKGTTTAVLPPSPGTIADEPTGTWALPNNVIGTVEGSVQSCMGLGPAMLSAQWGVNYSQNLGLSLSGLQARVLGASLNGKFHSSGTTIKDAALDIVVTDTAALARLANIPLKGGAFTLKARLVPTAAKIPSLKGQISLGAGRYDSVEWLSGEGSFEADPNAAALSLNIKGKLSARLRCSYNFSKELLRIESFELSESSKKIGAKLQKPTELCFANGLSVSNTDIALRPAGSVFVNGKLMPNLLDFEVLVEKIPLSMAKAFSSAPLPQGLLAAQMRIKGSAASPTGKFALQVADIPLATSAGSPKASLHVDGALARAATGKSSHSLNLKARWEGIDSLKNFEADAQIPLGFTPVPSLVMDAPLRAKLGWQGEISPLWRLVPLPGRSLKGKAEVQAQVKGSLRAPQLSGHVLVGQGTFVDSLEGILLDALQLEVRYKEQGNSLLRLRATDGRGGTLALDGVISDVPTAVAAGAGKAGAKKTAEYITLRGTINKLRPLRRDDVAVQLSGTLDISGPVQAPLIAGNICVDQAVVQLLNGFGGKTIKTLPVQDISAMRVPKSLQGASPSDILAVGGANSAFEASPPAGPRCDLRITAPGHVYIRGKGLDSEWKAELSISGPLDAPRILGSVNPIRGQLELLGHQFSMASGGISFSGANPPNPALDLTLEYKGADITALIMLSGSAKQPKMRLSSQPVLPNDEIIAHILFGKDINSLSRFEALQAANTARQLVDFGPSALDIMSSTRDILGLEVLRLGSASRTRQNRAPRDASLQGTSSTNPDDQAPTIEAGKYILDNVYVGLDQGTSANSGTAVRVEVELLPNLSLEGRTSNESSGVGINWKHDY